MKQKSLNLNMLLSAIKGFIGVIFPLITFPYISRILSVETLGKYNFAVSVVGYIVLLAGLGINQYAIREGARVREDKEKFGKLANQVFTINIISTIFAYLVLAVLHLDLQNLQRSVFGNQNKLHGREDFGHGAVPHLHRLSFVDGRVPFPLVYV